MPRPAGYVLAFGARLWSARQLRAVRVPPAVPGSRRCPGAAAVRAQPGRVQHARLCWGISEMAAAWGRAGWCPPWATGGPAELIPIVRE